MCGICGKVYFDPDRPVVDDDLRIMAESLAHRGPDGQGIWTHGHVGLAHRRLAIIDLRAVANQPMCNEDGTVWVTFNGEIYNFVELRQRLMAWGHEFRTDSDTEVIVHAYEQYGRDCVSHFRGMFAFAIWDAKAETLFLARDRVGKKPLYYACSQDRFLFGSEIKAILAEGSITPEPDLVAIDHFLALQYIPAPLSGFRHIQKLPAAHWLELRHGHVTIGRYWKLHYVPKQVVAFDEAIEELTWRLREAVRLRMVSDVPLGAFLSGGIDSSAVVALMAQETDRPVRTFCVGFQEAAFDERQYARMVAEQYGTHHTELLVTAPVRDLLPRLVWHYDEPLGDASAVPSYAIAELTRQHVTVVLNGDGGDENFAGYDRYVTDRLARYSDVIPQRMKQWGAALLQRLSRFIHPSSSLQKLARIAAVLALDPARRYAVWGAHFQAPERTALYTPAFQEAIGLSDPEGLFVQLFRDSDAKHPTDLALDADVQLYLADDLLVKMDRATMAHSLEARSPFLDHMVMEYVACLPPWMKLAGQQKKYLLKATLRHVIPDDILDRPKMGFCVPLAQWFRQDLRELAFDVLLSSRARQRGYFAAKEVERLLMDHCHAGRDHGMRLWDLLVLELWHRLFLDGEGFPARSRQSFVESMPITCAQE
ncbi:MAG: asparagine synthase (glutamine-hydrolyzing) [Nitrospirae bacterium]|nr:MAG: asparagine synthase (glutamine-hydrolyzing) [Nitrospirota bacterium]